VFDDFPAKMLEDVIFSMNNEELNAYKAIKESILEELNKIVNSNDREWVNHQIKAVIPVRMLRLKQCADHIRLLGIEGESSKLKALREKLKPIIESGEKAIIFTQFAEMLKILQEELAEYLPEVIFGAVSPEDRMKAVDRFNKKEGPGVIIMTEAGGMGLNIQSASYVFHYDAPWSIAKLTQREDRAHRYGQKKTVTVYNMVAKNTIDEYVAKVLHKKNKISVEILQDVERMSEVLINDESNMDVDTIREILRL
jgi:SNF2 family DNA or RNA helicase